MSLEIIRDQMTPPGEITVLATYDDITLHTAVEFARLEAQKEADSRDDVRHIARNGARFTLVGHPGHDPKYSPTSLIAEFSVRSKD